MTEITRHPVYMLLAEPVCPWGIHNVEESAVGADREGKGEYGGRGKSMILGGNRVP